MGDGGSGVAPAVSRGGSLHAVLDKDTGPSVPQGGDAGQTSVSPQTLPSSIPLVIGNPGWTVPEQVQLEARLSQSGVVDAPVGKAPRGSGQVVPSP